MRKRIVIFALSAIIAAAGFGACGPIKNLVEVVDMMTQDLPTASDTLTTLVEVSRAMEDAMKRGETEITFNATGISEDEIRGIGLNMSTFWGAPVRYSINNEFKGIEGIIPGKAVDVKNVTSVFELSNNFFVYDYIKNNNPIPLERSRAKEIADILPSIAAEIFSDPGATDYENALAAHDWLVAKIEYDENSPGLSEKNGSYGAFVLKETMCVGYSEALELLLRCYTETEAIQIVGEASNPNRLNAAGDTDGQGNDWGGHAWNAVKIDGNWYHIDVTFNDPIGDTSDQISHFYFGQNDEVMSKNHRWDADYFPAANAENFLYFRQSGKFMEDWDSFVAAFTGILAEQQVGYIEMAIKGATINEKNIQFAYKVRRNLDEIWWRSQSWEDVNIVTIELLYR